MDEVRAVPMAENMNIENTAGVKRKVEETDPKGKATILSNGTPEKKLKVDSTASPLIEIKGRKLIFKQAPLTFNTRSYISSHLRRMLLFNEWLCQISEPGGQEAGAITIPEKFYDLVIEAAGESTAKSEATLVKQIKKNLLGSEPELIDGLPDKAFASIVPTLFLNNNYGFIPSDFPPSTSAVKIPATLQFKIWESRDPAKICTPEVSEVLVSRIEERKRARVECLRYLESLDDIEKLELLRGDKEKVPSVEKEKVSRKEIKDVHIPIQIDEDVKPKNIRSPSPAASSSRLVREGSDATASSRRSTSPGRRSKLSPEEEEARRLKKVEQDAKKAVKAAARAAREEEIEKKRSIAAKQAQGFTSFFKPKPAMPKPPLSRASEAGPSTPVVRDKTVEVSDFVKTFKPVVRRQHIEWAPVNRWSQSGRFPIRSTEDASPREVTGADIESWRENGCPGTSDWTGRDFLSDHLRKHDLRSGRPRGQLPHGMKSAPLYGSAGEMWIAYQEAEDPRKVLKQLKSRHKFPWKTLAFDQQTRPPYCGTFTKRSVTVGPRTPFAQDPGFDYSYDSGDEWQEEEGGDDVDEPDVAEESAGEEEDESEGEFDDWLDDTEEGGPAADVDDDMPVPVPNPQLDQTRLPMKVVKKSREVPKKVEKLAQYVRGPLWERKIGEGHEKMQEYRIQVLNDAPDSIDPFIYVSSEPMQTYKSTISSTVIGANLAVRCMLATESIEIETSRKPVCNTATDANPDPEPPLLNGVTSTPAKTKSSGPKIAFPSSHLAELLKLIEGNTKIRVDLISELRAHFENVTTKGAIEAKIKEVADRIGKTKDSQWKVRPEAWQAAGLSAPTTELNGL